MRGLVGFLLVVGGVLGLCILIDRERTHRESDLPTQMPTVADVAHDPFRGVEECFPTCTPLPDDPGGFTFLRNHMTGAEASRSCVVIRGDNVLITGAEIEIQSGACLRFEPSR